MTVSEISYLNEWQTPLPDLRGVTTTLDIQVFDCQRKLQTWSPPPFYVPNPLLPRGEFFPYSVGIFGFYETVLSDAVMARLLQKSGELLPIHVNGNPAYLLNVLECCDALDQVLSLWSFNPRTRSRGILIKPSFISQRIPLLSLFKVPEVCNSRLFLSSDDKHDAEDDFLQWYTKMNYSGIAIENLCIL